MKLRTKRARKIVFFVRDPKGGDSVPVAPKALLTSRQARALVDHPETLLLFARHLKARASAEGRPGAQVTAQVWATVNDGPYSLLVDPEADLATAPLRRFGRNSWILDRPARPEPP